MTDPDAPPAADPAPDAPQARLPAPPEPAVSPQGQTVPPGHTVPPQQAVPPEQTVPPRPRGDALPWLCGVGFVLLACGIGYVGWLTQRPSPAVATLAQRVAALEQRPAGPGEPAAGLQSLQARVAALEHRPTPDLAALQPQLAALQAQLAALQQRQAPDLAPLQAQVAALQHDQDAAQARLAALEKQVAAATQSAAGTAQLTDRLNAVSTQVQALSARDQNTDSSLSGRLDAAEARLTALERSAAQMTQTAQHAARLARIEVAQVALAAGYKLGDIDGAPPAVAQFATTAPPTEAALRLAFPKAAQAALAAAGPATGGQAFLQQMLTRAEDLVTVRQGDRVLLGNPAAGVLARAHTALDAGDLAGAAAAVSSLSGPPAAAMADWLAQARAVLAARAGLAAMAAHA